MAAVELAGPPSHAEIAPVAIGGRDELGDRAGIIPSFVGQLPRQLDERFRPIIQHHDRRGVVRRVTLTSVAAAQCRARPHHSQ